MSEKSVDVEGMCRTCMSNRLKGCRGTSAKIVRRCIYEKPIGWNEGPTIMELLRSVQPEIPIHVKDKLPKIICHECIEQLQMSYGFLQMYKDTDEKFRKMLKDCDPIVAEATAFVEVKSEHIVQDEDDNPIINIETDRMEDDTNYDAIGMSLSEPGGSSPILEFEIEIDKNMSKAMHTNGSKDNKPSDSASDCDDGIWTSIVTSKRNSNNAFNQLLIPVNEDGSVTCQECKKVQGNVTFWQEHMLGHNSTREHHKKRRKDTSNPLDYSGEGADNSTSTLNDLDVTNQHAPYPQTESAIMRTVSYAGEMEFTNFCQPTNLISHKLKLQKLPSIQDIKKICEFQDGLKRPTLKNNHRTKLAKALISYIQKRTPNVKLLREDFLQLSQSILDIFPSEVQETYYVPFRKGHSARGKLLDAYNNNRARLRAAGLIRKRGRTRSKGNHNSAFSISSVKGFESGSDLEASLSTPNSSLINSPIEQTDCLQKLPSTEDIRQIIEFRDELKVPTMENKHRTKLAKAIISFILKKTPDRKLTREDFLQLAQSIVDIFPSEVNTTYYVPFRDGRIARGKLLDAYNNARSRLSAAGLISRRFKKKSE